MIWAAISWYSAGLIITLNGRLTASDYVEILGNQVHPVVLMLFPSNGGICQDDNSPIHTTKVFSVCLRSMKMHFNTFPGQQTRQT